MRAQVNLLDEIIVDNFAGGGGASTGMELATGRVVDIAINHDPDAILMHKTNHPHTTHYQASVWDVDPVEVCAGRPVGLAWFSPDCKHFSKAKGGKPVDKAIRGLAWIALRWAGTVRPRVIILENVEEFQTWGPVRRGKPVKSKKGQTFQRFVRQLHALGYDVQWRELVAANYGAPTTRKRFFLIARCDGRAIIWPEATHASRDSQEVKNGEKLPWRSAAEIIDWSLPCPSIFDTRVEIKEKYGLTAQRPLQPNTLRRVARGLDKFVIQSANPFNVDNTLPMGIPAFANAIDQLQGVDIAYDSYVNEFVLGKKRIMVKPGATKDLDGNPVFDVNELTYYVLPEDTSDGNVIAPIDMNLRTAEHNAGLQDMLNALSSRCGFGENHYKFDNGNVSTATQVISENSTLFRTVRKHEIILESVLKEIAHIALRLGNAIMSSGLNEDVEISIDFDDSIIEDKQVEFNRTMQLLNAGLMKPEEARAILMNEDEETAKAALPGMEDMADEKEEEIE